jgi:hypothetical protein
MSGEMRIVVLALEVFERRRLENHSFFFFPTTLKEEKMRFF